jgi:hypothetical protein
MQKIPTGTRVKVLSLINGTIYYDLESEIAEKIQNIKIMAYVVIEKYCLTEFDEEYNGSLIKEVWTDRATAQKRANTLTKTAKDEGQDYKYEVEKYTLNTER